MKKIVFVDMDNKAIPALNDVRLYEDDWNYSCGLYMDVVNGQVSVYEHNIEEKAPDCLRRILAVELKPLLTALHVTDKEFIEDMRERRKWIEKGNSKSERQ